jgi:phosphate:Na+ symporter
MDFDVWTLLAGVGIFLFGIFLLEESLKALSGKAFKSIIRKYTSTPLRSIMSGTMATALLQSSSAVTLMVLAFVGAGLMTLTNAIGVVLGSNLGTTLTSWIVAAVGFKFSIEAFALPFIGIGGLGLIFFGRQSRASNVSKLMVGFGFLFLGLDYMKESVGEMAANVDLNDFRNFNILFFLAIGFVITAIMQSSSAAMAIILTAVYAGVISFYNATAMVIGINMGTTITVLIGSLGGVMTKKQVAMAHVIFNLVTGILALIFLRPLNNLVLQVFPAPGDRMLAIALFHTLFNLAGVLVFLPFVNPVASLIMKIIKDKKERLSLYIHKVTSEVPEAALEAIRKETSHLVRLAMLYNLKVFNLDPSLAISMEELPKDRGSSSTGRELYSSIKSIQSEIFMFSSELQGRELSGEEASRLNRILQSIHHSVASAKNLKDIAHELDEMDQSEIIFNNQNFQKFRKVLLHVYTIIDELLVKENNVINLPRLVKTMDTIRDDEHDMMKDFSHSLRNMSGNNISSYLSASRSFYLSLRQMTLAVKDLILTQEQSEIYENMELSETDLKKFYPEELRE